MIKRESYGSMRLLPNTQFTKPEVPLEIAQTLD